MAGKNTTPIEFLYPFDFTVQPSVGAPGEPDVTAANGTEYLMESRKPLVGTNRIRLWAISNTNNIGSNPKSLLLKGVEISTQSFAEIVPATEPNVPGLQCFSNRLPAPFLDAVFAGFQSTIQRASGKLYGVLPFGAVDSRGLARDAIAWFVVTPSVNSRTGAPSARIFRQGYVVPPDGYSLLNPAFGLNKSGAGIIGFSITNQSQFVPGGFPSTGFIGFNGTSVTGNIAVTGQGVASDDGFTGCEPSSPSFPVGRWGDYGAAAVDAATGAFYVANETISGTRGTFSNWGTFITQVDIYPSLAASDK